jgi:hypothetical protein
LIEQLNKQIEPENKYAAESVIMQYHRRIADIEQRQNDGHSSRNIFNNKEKLRFMSMVVVRFLREIGN